MTGSRQTLAREVEVLGLGCLSSGIIKHLDACSRGTRHFLSFCIIGLGSAVVLDGIIELGYICCRKYIGISLPYFYLACTRILLADGRNIHCLVEITLGVRGCGLSRDPICLGYRKRLANLSAINIGVTLHQVVTTLIDAVITFSFRDIQATASV